jgi:hypothetical protein
MESNEGFQPKGKIAVENRQAFSYSNNVNQLNQMETIAEMTISTDSSSISRPEPNNTLTSRKDDTP